MTNQTAADELRTAAITIRCKANAATPGPWTARVDYPHLVLQGGDDVVSTNLAGSPAEDAEHIAGWHPAVALAVADWLESVADRIDRTLSRSAALGEEPTRLAERHHAFTVARAYLGTTEQVTV